jgi:adenylate cyclase
MSPFAKRFFATRTPEEFKELSRRVVYRHPVRTAILSQIGFWIIANSLLVLSVWQVLYRASLIYPQVISPPLPVMLTAACLGAIIYGTLLGGVDIFLNSCLSGDLPLGLRILIKSTIYTVVLVAIMIMVTSGLRMLVGEDWAEQHGMIAGSKTGFGFLWVIVPYALVCNVLMSALKQIDASFGPGVLSALLLGRYRRPVREHRVFMFMDLRSSTKYAEQLGHERYSAMIRDLFSGMDETIRRFDAEVYQYVGDEVVFTWNSTKGTRDQRCLLFFFAIEDGIRARRDHYVKEYGLVPEFKAGVHLGEVTTVEIGTIKREIAYHGDAINTAARIQGLCNSLERTVVISDDVLRACGDINGAPVRIEDLGSVQLKGKAAPTFVHAVSR